MSWDSEGDLFVVVVNEEEQYALWPDHRPLPAGWRLAGQRGDKQTCMEYVDRTWTDMRPRSLREAIASRNGSSA